MVLCTANCADLGAADLDIQFRGLPYHVWEFQDGEVMGAETNVYHAGRSEDVLGDYEKKIADVILGWPDMAVPG